MTGPYVPPKPPGSSPDVPPGPMPPNGPTWGKFAFFGCLGLVVIGVMILGIGVAVYMMNDREIPNVAEEIDTPIVTPGETSTSPITRAGSDQLSREEALRIIGRLEDLGPDYSRFSLLPCGSSFECSTWNARSVIEALEALSAQGYVTYVVEFVPTSGTYGTNRPTNIQFTTNASPFIGERYAYGGGRGWGTNISTCTRQIGAITGIISGDRIAHVEYTIEIQPTPFLELYHAQYGNHPSCDDHIAAGSHSIDLRRYDDGTWRP